MAITIDWPTQVISIPRADLTLVSGTIYTCDTNAVRLELKSIEAGEGMPFVDTHRHNTEVTVAGITYARTIEIINGYSIQFTPDEQWTVILEGSNNNFFDVQNGILVQNQVQVISTNAAGLILNPASTVAPTQQQIRDAMTLPSGAEASIDSKLNDLETKQLDLWQDAGLDAANPKTVTDVVTDKDIDESAGGVDKEIRTTGGTTTITRQ